MKLECAAHWAVLSLIISVGLLCGQPNDTPACVELPLDATAKLPNGGTLRLHTASGVVTISVSEDGRIYGMSMPQQDTWYHSPKMTLEQAELEEWYKKLLAEDQKRMDGYVMARGPWRSNMKAYEALGVVSTLATTVTTDGGRIGITAAPVPLGSTINQLPFWSDGDVHTIEIDGSRK